MTSVPATQANSHLPRFVSLILYQLMLALGILGMIHMATNNLVQPGIHTATIEKRTLTLEVRELEKGCDYQWRYKDWSMGYNFELEKQWSTTADCSEQNMLNLFLAAILSWGLINAVWEILARRILNKRLSDDPEPPKKRGRGRPPKNK